MSEWWTYRPSDFLLYSARTYYRLFELHNAAVWPVHVLTVGLGLTMWVALWQGRAFAPRAACTLLGAAWLWVAWAFHWQRFASIHWAAAWFAAAFAGQGLLMWAWAALRVSGSDAGSRSRARPIGLALVLVAIVVQPVIGALLGRPWQQAEVFGVAPDPTVLGTLGLLLLLPRTATTRLLWPIPLLWCAFTGMTLATMSATDALLLPAAATLAIAAAIVAARTGPAR